MEKRWNINSFLCKQADDNITNIRNIFNKIEVKNNDTASFCIITLLNAFQSDEKNFRLYYFIEQMGEDKRAYVGNQSLTRDTEMKKDSNGECVMARIDSSVSVMLKAEIQNVYFPKTGQYELQVYKYDNEESVDIDNETPDEQSKWANENHLVATYPFNVVING